ncbi:MAG: CRP/FNR family cyclic AMP-dependent transcriptional regulator [Candidatus Latescibacterota bacterium]|jgi:CRP/FNR family cyclic AMP-dependent transcriptional regulator
MFNKLFRRGLRDNPLVRVLREIPLFRELSRGELREVVQTLEVASFAIDDVVFKQDDPGRGMFIVLSGGVDIFQMDEDGARLHLSRSEVGSFFGETALLDDAPRTASAIVFDEAELALFSRHALLNLAENRPHLGVKIAMQLSQIIAERLRRTNRGLRSARDEVGAAQKAKEEGAA